MKTEILGIKIDALNYNQSLQKIEDFLRQDKQHQIITVNPEIILKSLADSNYREIINQVSLVTADGIGLLWAAKFLSLKSDSWVSTIAQMIASGASLVFYPSYCQEVIPERITGVDLMDKICRQASIKGWKIYLFGGGADVAEKTAEVLRKKYLNLQIVGAEEGIKNYQSGQNTDEAISKINEKAPDIIFVAMGAPKQEYFISQNLSKIPSVKIAMGVGGSFDFISGKIKRAPDIYRDLGLEWLYRFFHQPWRALRIFNATVKFIWTVIKFKQLTKN